MSDDDLALVVADLAARVAAIEAAGPAPSPVPAGATDLGLVKALVDALPTGEDGEPVDGSVVYAGAGPGPDGTTALQMAHSWNDLMSRDGEALAACLAAMGSPVRLQIIRVLLGGPATTSGLTGALDTPSAGQLFHHLKELLAVGLIHQPGRGTYAIHPAKVVSIITALACASDLVGPARP